MLFFLITLRLTSRDSKQWNTSGIEGVHRFLGRTWRLIVGPPSADGSFNDGTVASDEEPTLEQLRSLHKCITKVIYYLNFVLLSFLIRVIQIVMMN